MVNTTAARRRHAQSSYMQLNRKPPVQNKTIRNKPIRNKPNLTSFASATASTTFTESDYLSGYGFNTRVWGPCLWHTLHMMSFNIPATPSAAVRSQYRKFIYSLRHVLPCGACRTNLTANLRDMPLTDARMRTREQFSRYIFELHEKINVMLKKPSGLTYEQVRERYEHFRAICKAPIVSPVAPSPTMNHTRTQTKRITHRAHAGCTNPLYGVASKCTVSIVPVTNKTPSLTIHRECLKRRTRTPKNNK